MRFWSLLFIVSLVLVANGQEEDVDEFDADLAVDTGEEELLASNEEDEFVEKPSPTSTSEKSEFDDDEFERPVEQQRKGKTGAVPSTSTKESKPEPQVVTKRDFASLLQLYWMECTFVVFLLCYTGNFFLGRAKNLQIATAWISAYAPLFRDNFAKVGGEAVFTKQGANIFTTTASGRINCLGAEVTIELKKRHDLLSVATEYFFPTEDKVTIDVAMEPTMEMMVFAIISRRDDRNIRSQTAHKDIATFAQKERITNVREWPATELALYSDSVELIGDLLPEKFARVICQHSKQISIIHFTDQSLIVPNYTKTLRFVFRMPESNNMKNLSELMELVPAYIDLVARTKLTQMAEKKATKVRQDFMKEVKKEKEDAQEEKRLEDKRRKEQEAFSALSKEEKQRELVKRKKREEKKKMKGGKMKIVFA